MSDVIIFLFGLLVTGMTVVATILVGLSEASDTNMSREKDLTDVEKKLVGKARGNDEAD